jgi:hypothetical protein
MSQMTNLSSPKAKMDFKASAAKFKELCEQLGWVYRIRGSVVSIEKCFTPNDNGGFVTCDSQYYGILCEVPVTKSNSSIWGTDGGGIGALSAIKYGHFTMNISGVKSTFIKELNKL